MKTIIFIKKTAKKEETTKKNNIFSRNLKISKKSLNLHFEEPIEKICINISV